MYLVTQSHILTLPEKFAMNECLRELGIPRKSVQFILYESGMLHINGKKYRMNGTVIEELSENVVLVTDDLSIIN